MSWDKEKLERVQAIASIASSIAMPIVIAVAGFLVQRQFTADGLKKDYVQIAASILKENAATQEPDLRKWAVQTLDENAPIPFSKKAKQGLQTGAAVVMPGLPLIPPPADCMKVGKRSRIEAFILRRPKDQPFDQAAIDQLLKLLPGDLYEMASAQNRLNCLQEVFRNEQKSDDRYRAAIGAMSSASEIESYRKAAPASAASSASSAGLVRGRVTSPAGG